MTRDFHQKLLTQNFIPRKIPSKRKAKHFPRHTKTWRIYWQQNCITRNVKEVLQIEGKVKVKLLSRVRLFATPWTAAHQAPLSMGVSRQEYWSGVPSPFPGLWSMASQSVRHDWATDHVHTCRDDGGCRCYSCFLTEARRQKYLNRIQTGFSFMSWLEKELNMARESLSFFLF